MPPPVVKTVKDLIFYQYAKIIVSSSGRSGFGFIIERMKKLSSGEIEMSTVLRELKKQMTSCAAQCEYCGSKEDLSWDHLIPRSKGGPDTADNLVLACKSCNSSKGSKGIYQWYGLKRKDDLPRVVAGKYLKLLYEIHERNGTLNASNLDDDGRLTVLDLEMF